MKNYMFEEMKEMTKKLVSIPSVNGTDGEAIIADYMYSYLVSLPYFQTHPELLFMQPIPDDPLGRKSVFALLQGTKGTSSKTLIFHGHIDTVGVDDLGVLKEFAFDCDSLAAEMLKLPQSDAVRDDLRSGDYLFGRGTADMKSGDAVFLVLMKYLSRHPERINGNILCMFNPVEENQHTGVIEGLQILEDLQRTKGLEYLFAINNDYICPMYEGDKTRYIYTGAMGKILPCMYVLGKETHVGQCFEGVNAISIAARLVSAIDLEPTLCDVYDGESTLPPMALKSKDLKPWYNVQSALEAYCYFSYMVENSEMTDILQQLKHIAERELQKQIDDQQRKMAAYAEQAGLAYKQPDFQGKVYLFDELLQLAREQGADNIPTMLAEFANKGKRAGMDPRDISLEAVRMICRNLQLDTPVIVIFLAPPYLPHTTLHQDIGKEKKLIDSLAGILEQMENNTGEHFQLLHYFPSLSDSSYLKIDDSDESVGALIHNFPLYEQLFPIPVDRIKELSIPGINYGCYGKDAHKRTERVYMPYSFEILPKLIQATVDQYL